MREERAVRQRIKSVLSIQRSVVVYPEANPRGQQAPVLLPRTLADHCCLRPYLEAACSLRGSQCLMFPAILAFFAHLNRLYSLIFLHILPRRIVPQLISL